MSARVPRSAPTRDPRPSSGAPARRVRYPAVVPKLRVGVIFGGRSTEHEVSVVSATTVVKGLDPSRIAEYCFDLCKSFAFVFTDKENHPIVTCDDAQLRHGRLLMVAAIGHTLRTALGLLGIEVLEEM